MILPDKKIRFLGLTNIKIHFTSHYIHVRKITLRQLVTLFNVTHSAMVGHGLCAGVPEFMGSVSFKLLRNCWPWLASSAQLRKALASLSKSFGKLVFTVNRLRKMDFVDEEVPRRIYYVLY